MKECDSVGEEKILIGFYNDSIELYMNTLEKFDKDGFKVNVFDNIGDVNVEEFSIDNILFNLLGENYNKKFISIISNNEELLLYLYKKFSFLYNAFILDNSISNCKVNIDEKNVYKCNFNLYSVVENTGCIYLQNTDVYGFSQGKLENYINSSKKICEDEYNFKEYYKITNEKAMEIKKYIEKLSDDEKRNIQLIIEESIDNENIKHQVYLYSFLLLTFNKRKYAEVLINRTINSKNLSKENRFFIMYQLIAKGFTNNRLADNINSCGVSDIYDKAFEEFECAVGDYKFISKKYRDKNLVFVFISQMLTLNHAPTKTVLDRCYSLIKDMKKKVILINTCELVTFKGIIPFDCIFNGHRAEEYSELSTFKYKDVEIPFYQPSDIMPDENECINILNMVKKYKPYFLLNIGGNSITADLCSKIVPMATISTSGNFEISKTKGQFFLYGRKPKESDYINIEKMGYKRESIIECQFTYDFKAQENKYNREEFGIPEEKFVVTIIGARIQAEIDEEFVKVLNVMADKGCYIVTIGEYVIPEYLKEKYPQFANNFKGLGFQDDVLACIELIDVYINPKRQGGGSSAVECMYKSKPVFSLNFGDVSTLVPKESLVKDYDEMITLVEKCKKDSDFYNKMAQIGKEKAMDLMDTKKYFKKAIEELVCNPLFK